MIRAGTEPPRLSVIIDTEEEFDWSGPFRREARSVATIKEQYRAQEIFARHDLVPTYVIDHPVASDPEAVEILKDFQDNDAALIGAHLHPWVSPPYDEAIGRRNSYPGNLPSELEYEKLRRLTDCIENNFGRRPVIYKAGRYGIGPNTPDILRRLGYRVDCSVVPYTDFSDDQGPDFSHETPFLRPFDVGGTILELPLSVGFAGRLAGFGMALYPVLFRLPFRLLRLPGLFARSRMLERIRLTPEGVSVNEMQRLTRAMLARGIRHFCLTYHSPSLAPGHTPYVRDEAGRDQFLGAIAQYCAWFCGELGGIGSTPLAEYRRWRKDQPGD